MKFFPYAALSFGAGVQSSALLLLIKHDPQLLIDAVGHLPNKAYFADTGAEPQAIYKHLELMHACSSIPIKVVNNGSLLSADTQNGIQPRTFPPYFTKNPDGSVGMLRRKCTSEFKIVPVEQAVRRDVGLVKGQRGKSRSVAMWLGISVEEISRMGDNKTKLFQNIYPLVELGWNRSKCFAYCQEHGITPAKSRCIMCPYISDWVEIKRNQPVEFKRAVEFDREIRGITNRGLDNPVYLHRSCKPLDEAIENQGHLWEGYADSFDNECFGVCGT